MHLTRSPLSAAQHYLLKDIQSVRLRNGVRFVTLGIALVVGIWIIYFLRVAIAYPYPLEYREGAQQVLTKLLLARKNPFSLENQPLGMNNYGILYSLTALPLAAVFGNTLLVHRIVTLVFLLLCSLLVFWTIFKGIQDTGLAIVCGEMVMVALAALGRLGAFPVSMGMFLFLAAILIPFNRHFDRAGLVLSDVLCLLAFYAKPYFLLALGIVATYLFLFASKKKALIYGLFFAILFGIVFFFVRAILPLYFLDVIVSNLTQAHSVGPAPAFLTLEELCKEFCPGLAVTAAVLIAGWPSRSSEVTNAKGTVPPGILTALDRPLLAMRFNYLAYTCICGLLAFTLILGANEDYRGNDIAYSYQLVLVPFCMWLFRELKPRSRLSLILVPVLLANLVLLCLIRFSPNDLSQLREKTKGWERLYAYVDSSNRILNSPEIASEMLRRGLWPVDSGQTEYYYWIRDCPIDGWLGPSCNVVEKDGEQYLDSIQAAVASRYYDYVIATNEWALPHDQNLISRNYEETKVISIAMPLTQQSWQVVIWERLK